MSAKHTPGPWEYATAQDGWMLNIHQADNAPYTPGYSDVAWSMYTVSGEAKDIQEANARLIAASPDLLEALEEIVSGIDEADELHESGVAIDWQIVVRAKALIAKARGEK